LKGGLKRPQKKKKKKKKNKNINKTEVLAASAKYSLASSA